MLFEPIGRPELASAFGLIPPIEPDTAIKFWQSSIKKALNRAFKKINNFLCLLLNFTSYILLFLVLTGVDKWSAVKSTTKPSSKGYTRA